MLPKPIASFNNPDGDKVAPRREFIGPTAADSICALARQSELDWRLPWCWGWPWIRSSTFCRPGAVSAASPELRRRQSKDPSWPAGPVAAFAAPALRPCLTPKPAAQRARRLLARWREPGGNRWLQGSSFSPTVGQPRRLAARDDHMPDSLTWLISNPSGGTRAVPGACLRLRLVNHSSPMLAPSATGQPSE